MAVYNLSVFFPLPKQYRRPGLVQCLKIWWAYRCLDAHLEYLARLSPHLLQDMGLEVEGQEAVTEMAEVEWDPWLPISR
ncbi:hypothetical protein [Aestuariispira insulae]|uniref:DUF1127 domain-containing protein n=1 Tax=Aestuariispira insulae TaxID=1461337 RepID=A0A3D9HLM8_9PROT|nr:hypothetical protein [Aestuariispira insulae]RED49796.1 hypothetical protein DFP90_105168 [Aestuariispira insulae]